MQKASLCVANGVSITELRLGMSSPQQKIRNFFYQMKHSTSELRFFLKITKNLLNIVKSTLGNH